MKMLAAPSASRLNSPFVYCPLKLSSPSPFPSKSLKNQRSPVSYPCVRAVDLDQNTILNQDQENNLKLLVSCALHDAKKISVFFDNAPMFKLNGCGFPVDIYYTKAPEAQYLIAAMKTALEIHVKKPLGDGDVLVFLTSEDEIETAIDILKQMTRRLRRETANLIICTVDENSHKELQTHKPKGARKLFLATNVAETLWTVGGIKYIIDMGFCKVKSYDPLTCLESLVVTCISKASADQRAARSGMAGRGQCFRMYTADDFCSREDSTAPEIEMSSIASVVLVLKGLDINDVLEFPFIDSSQSKVLQKALELLKALSALDKDCNSAAVAEPP